MTTGKTDRAQIKADLRAFERATTRFQRYRLAKKTLKFGVYRFMEAYVVASVLGFITTHWLEDGLPRSLLLNNVWVVAMMGPLHNLKLISDMPWLLMAAAFEGWLLRAAHHWLFSHWQTVPNFYVYCVALAVFRYWERGEKVIDVTAYSTYLESEAKTSAVANDA